MPPKKTGKLILVFEKYLVTLGIKNLFNAKTGKRQDFGRN
jgi:hypothetical protein